MKSLLTGLHSRNGHRRKRIDELKERSIKISYLKHKDKINENRKKKKEKRKNQIRACKTCGTIMNTHNWNPEGKKERQWCRENILKR